MRHVTLIGVNHLAGVDGLLPEQRRATHKNVEKVMQSLFNQGFQTVLKIELDKQDITIHNSLNHSRTIDLA